jgi:hypothetical protein
MKKLLLLVLGLAAVSGALLVAAETAEVAENAGEKSATAWLALVDAGKYGESWDGAAELFRQAMTRPQWEGTLDKVRTPLGKMVSRKLKAAKFMRDLPGAPAGDYVVIQYDTNFAAQSGATETVTPMKDKDGAWRVAGYFIK